MLSSAWKSAIFNVLHKKLMWAWDDTNFNTGTWMQISHARPNVILYKN